MRDKVAGSLIAFLGMLFMLFGFYTSFELYVKNRLTEVFQDVGSFNVKVFQDSLPAKSGELLDNIFFFKTSEGKVYSNYNLNKPLDTSKYYSFVFRQEGYEYVVYMKHFSFYDYVGYLYKNPMSLGVFISGLIFFFMGIYLVGSYKASQIVVEKEKPPMGESQDLINHLKALRLTLATSKVIPEESIQKTKELIDRILKKGGSA